MGDLLFFQNISGVFWVNSLHFSLLILAPVLVIFLENLMGPG